MMRYTHLDTIYDIKIDQFVTGECSQSHNNFQFTFHMNRILLIQEREAAYEREQERIRREKEAETARLRALQERASDEKAIRDALQAKRAAEQNERNWRKKEAEDEVKRVETEQMLKKSRLKQIEQKQHYMGIQAQREKADFQRVLRFDSMGYDHANLSKSNSYLTLLQCCYQYRI